MNKRVMGLRADHALAEALRTKTGLEVHVIGDCPEPRVALEAVWEGLEAGQML